MARRTVVVRLNRQQLELLDRTSQRGKAADRVSLVRKALREQAGKRRRRGHPIIDRNVLLEMALEPGTGKALEVKAGQILRIDQIEGLQCVDFNCFNMHDYKEFMRCAPYPDGAWLQSNQGAFFWSAPPRERALTYILKDTVGRNDVLFPRCSAYVYESATSSCRPRSAAMGARPSPARTGSPATMSIFWRWSTFSHRQTFVAPTSCERAVLR